ncbi:hypothetical protein QUF74_11975 [Candidatus Halobeggiatoa sp. HSG11]|nr:hypothetical protein [Candidatus Halobeggiatoa sp. HSG11]
MYTEKLILETDANGYLKQMPKLPPNIQLVVVLKENQPQSSQRKPSAKIAGKGLIKGDIMESVIATEDWNVLT